MAYLYLFKDSSGNNKKQMKPFRHITITLFILASLLIGGLSYGQTVLHACDTVIGSRHYSFWQTNPAWPDTVIGGGASLMNFPVENHVRTFTYTDPFGWQMINVFYPADKKGLYLIDNFNDSIVLFDNPLRVTDSLKAIKGLLITLHVLIDERIHSDSVQAKRDEVYYLKGKCEAYFEMLNIKP